MNLYRLSLFSIAACLVGLIVMLTVTARGVQQVNAQQPAFEDLMSLNERINNFSAASDSMLLGADAGLWAAFRGEGRDLADRLERLSERYPEASKAAKRVRIIIESVGAALDVRDNQSLASIPDAEFGSLDLPIRSRIIMQQVADQGIALDTALDYTIYEHQQALARETRWIGATLAGAALFFGALCVFAFSLIHRRIAVPMRALNKTLERIRAGDTDARAAVPGNDELSRLAQTLNTLFDERRAADRAVEEHKRSLEGSLSKFRETRDQLVRAQRVGRIGNWEGDLDHGRLEWSAQVFEIFGIREADFNGTIEAFFELVHPDDRERLAQARDTWQEYGGDLDAEHRIVRPDGQVRWVRERAQFITVADGESRRAFGTVQDITDFHRMDQRLRQFREVLEGSDDLCGIIDDTYHFIWVNPAYAGWYGMRPEQIEGQPVARILAGEHFERMIKPYLDRCLAGELQRFEAERDHPELGARKVLIRYYPIDVPGEDRRSVGFVLTDITDIRSAEAELAQQARLLEIAGRVARIGGWSVNLQNDTSTWSDVTAQIHAMPDGYSASVEEGIAFYAPEYRDRIRELFTACAERGEPYNEELQIIDAEGQRRWVRTIGEAVRDNAGSVIEVQGAFQDISERKELELERHHLADRLGTMLESITDGFVAFDEQWRYTYVNAEGARMLGKTEDELLGTSVWSQFPDAVGSAFEAVMRRAMDERRPGGAEELFAPLKTWFDARAYPQAGGVALFFRDVTDRHRMLEQLQVKEAALRESYDSLNAALIMRQALINSLPAHIALLDSEANVVDVNEQWRHFGEQNDFTDADSGVGSNYLRICEASTDECSKEAGAVAEGLREVLAGDRGVFALEYPCHAPDEERWFRVTFNRLAWDHARPGGVVAMHVDITERKLAEQQLEKLAYEDPLTGLLSRNGFARELKARLESRDWQPNGVLAIVDVAGQHDINDTHGYERGDRLLVELGHRIQTRCGRHCLVGRYSGDEFVVHIAPASNDTVEQTLRDLSNVVQDPFVVGGATIEVQLQIGYTALGEERRGAEELMREAELALFENRKTSGAAPFWLGYTPEMDAQTQNRIRMTEELRHAIKAEEFELHLQPQVDLTDGSLISAEALIRWHHPERGLQPPGLFIPIAEQSQLIGPIGDWALRDACRQLRGWRAAGLEIVRISVNVSVVQFALGDFPAKVQAALEDFDVAPSKLSLEITESVFERHSDALLANMRELREFGVHLSLDDFGTGYSSLLYLHRYPFDEIKIDRAFVSHLLDDDYSRNIVRTVIDVAGALDASVVAEGIESPEISAALLEMGVRIGQGFYYSVPLEAEDFRWLLDKRSRLPLKSG